MDDLINDINEASEKITQETKEDPIDRGRLPDTHNDMKEEIEQKRKELLLLSSDGVVSKSVAYINKASAKVIEKLYAEYEAKRLNESAEFLCDLFLSKFAMLLGGLDAVESPEEMEKELKDNPLLKDDVKKIAKSLAPIIPFLGVLTGGLTVGKHVWGKRKNTPTVDPESPEGI